MLRSCRFFVHVPSLVRVCFLVHAPSLVRVSFFVHVPSLDTIPSANDEEEHAPGPSPQEVQSAEEAANMIIA